jgi:catechol 2,3-dioxygenase-like lactoylglutathione lyase family enzyme
MPHPTHFLALNPVIPVRNMAATVSFYEQQLGFTKVFDDAAQPDAAFDYAGLARGGLCLHLQTMAPDENPTMPLIRIQVENIESLYDEYRAKGVISPGGALEAKPWGSKDFGVYDVNGAALVFYEDL